MGIGDKDECGEYEGFLKCEGFQFVQYGGCCIGKNLGFGVVLELFWSDFGEMLEGCGEVCLVVEVEVLGEFCQWLFFQ